MIDYSKLQNGSDIRGVAINGVKGETVNLTSQTIRRLTMGFFIWLKKKTNKERLTIAVGHDSRLSSEFILGLILECGHKAGIKMLNAKLASTPAMFMSTVFPEYNCDGAIMITASHLPYNRNGFKYFSVDGGLNKEDISEIIEIAKTDEILTGSGIVLPTDLMGRYSDYLRNKIIKEVNHPKYPNQPLKGLRILVDAGNGAGGFFATSILEPLGANIKGSQFLEPDGNFPNHAPNPEDKKAMKAICDAVTLNRADLGLIFDTDVDRSSAVDNRGIEINRNGIIALAAALISKEHPGTTIVTDSITNDHLTSFLEGELGLKHLRFMRGYKNVINKSIELNNSGIDSQLAIETSGHAAYKENYFLDDGAYLATKIVIKTAQLALKNKKINTILCNLKKPAEAIELRFPINCTNYSKYADSILKGLNDFAFYDKSNIGMSLVAPNYEGIRVNFNNCNVKGWCLLRKSLHDPIMPLNIESETPGGCSIIKEYLKELFNSFPDLDISSL